MAEKKATAKKATETKAAAAKKETVKKAAAPKAAAKVVQMFIRHWQQQVRLSPLRRLLRLQRFQRRRLFSVWVGSSRRASSLTMARKLHWHKTI